MTELLKILVVENKIVSYKYFCDDMNIQEIQLLLPLVKFSLKQENERTRLMCYFSCSPYLDKKKIKSLEDFLPLPTDEKKPNKQVKKEDITNLLKRFRKTK